MRTLLWFLISITVSIPAVASEPPILAVLEFGRGTSEEQTPIRATRSAQASPFQNRPVAVWRLREGDTLRQAAAPAERVIRFYTISGQDTQVVATFLVQYQRSNTGWRPGYAILSQPLVAWDGKQFKPIGTEDKARGLIQTIKTGVPDRNGLYQTLEFGLTSAPTQIDAWEVE